MKHETGPKETTTRMTYCHLSLSLSFVFVTVTVDCHCCKCCHDFYVSCLRGFMFGYHLFSFGQQT